MRNTGGAASVLIDADVRHIIRAADDRTMMDEHGESLIRVLPCDLFEEPVAGAGGGAGDGDPPGGAFRAGGWILRSRLNGEWGMNTTGRARGEPGWGRRVLAGLAAGALVNACEWAAHHWWLDAAWTRLFAALGKTPTGWSSFVPANFWLGILAVLDYRWATRIHGAAPRTAVRTAVAVWLVFGVIPTMAMQPLSIFPNPLLMWTIVVGAADATAGTLLGAWLYDRARWRSPGLDHRPYPRPVLS